MAEYDQRFCAFIPSYSNKLTCGICLGLLLDPSVTPCGHVFCKSCVEKWLNGHDTCPECREKVSDSSLVKASPVIINQIQTLEVQCMNRAHGCEEVCALEHYRTHMNVCPYQVIQCSSAFCEDTMLLKDKERHENDCKYSLVNCPKCGVLMFRPKVPKHNCMSKLEEQLKLEEHAMKAILSECELLHQSQEIDRECLELLQSAVQSLKLIDEVKRQIHSLKEIMSNRAELINELFK